MFDPIDSIFQWSLFLNPIFYKTLDLIRSNLLLRSEPVITENLVKYPTPPHLTKFWYLVDVYYLNPSPNTKSQFHAMLFIFFL